MPDQTDATPGRAEPDAGSTAWPEARSGWERFTHALWHPGRGQFLIAALLCALGVLVAMQVRAANDDQLYANTRREDLVQLLDGLNHENRRLQNEITDLEQTRAELESGGDAREVARAEARRREDDLAILAGEAPATGPGVRITITDTRGQVRPQMILDAVQELRDAGAESMEINDSIRVVESTWFGGTPGAVVADDVPLGHTIIIDAIGDSHALEQSTSFPGGLESQVTATDVGATLTVAEGLAIAVSSVHRPTEPRYAQPTR